MGYYCAHFELNIHPQRPALALHRYRCRFCHDWGDNLWLRSHRCMPLPWPWRVLELPGYLLPPAAWVTRKSRRLILAWQAGRVTR